MAAPAGGSESQLSRPSVGNSRCRITAGLPSQQTGIVLSPPGSTTQSVLLFAFCVTRIHLKLSAAAVLVSGASLAMVVTAAAGGPLAQGTLSPVLASRIPAKFSWQSSSSKYVLPGLVGWIVSPGPAGLVM